MAVTPEEAKKIKAKLAQLETSIFGSYIAQVHKNRSFYDGDYGVEIVPKAWQKYIVPFIPDTAAKAIDEPANHILNYPHIKVPQRPTVDDSEQEAVVAAVKRVFINSWWSNVNRMANPIGDGKRAYLNEGRICVKVTLDWDLIPDKPERDDFQDDASYARAKDKYRRDIAKLGEVEFPWKVEVLDNTTVFEDPSNHRNPEYVFIKYETFCEDAKRRWPLKEGESESQWRKRTDFEKVQYTEYWSKPKLNPDGSVKEPGCYLQWVGDELVHNADNPYPYVPILIEDNGLGVINALATPKDKYRGLTEKAFPTFISNARQLSSWQAVNELSAFPMGKYRNGTKDQIQIGPGIITPMEGAEGDPNAEDLVWMAHPDVPQGVVALFQTTQQLVAETYKFNILGGNPQKGVDTATEADQNVRNASAILSAPVAGLDRLCERISRLPFMDVELVLEAPVTIRGVGEGDPAEIKLMPSDIKGFYDVRAELRTSDEDAIAMNKARFWIEMALRAPFLSYETAMVRGEITEDPVTERLRRAAEDVFLSPEFKQIRVLTGAQSFGQLAAALQAGDQTATSAVNQLNTVGAPTGDAQQDVISTAYANRDTQQGSAQLGY